MDTFQRNLGRCCIEWLICISVVFRFISSDRNSLMIYESFIILIINSRRRLSSVATLDAVRFHDAQGAVSVPNQSSYAQHSHNIFLYLYTPTANGSLVNPAKTVRPREKSFISAISRFHNAARKKNMNDVRGQEMSENTLLSFLIFAKFSFLRFAEKLRGSGKKWPTS